jgi:signal transduction histidine kinase
VNAQTEGESFDVLELKDGRSFEGCSQPQRVADAIVGRVWSFRDISRRRQAEARLAETHQQLLATSRQAGMAEVATGVLHNVGNVLNSVNVSATLVAEHVRHSQASGVAKLATLFAEHESDLPAFLTQDPRGRMVPNYLATLRDSLAGERQAVIAEIEHLRKNLEHIKDIVAMQQNYAKTSGFIETVALTDVVEDALRMNASSLARHEVELVRDFQIRPVVTTDKHKVVQILVNLVRNAKHACDDSGRSDKRITVRLAGGGERVRIAVADNGVGIPAENLARIFNHGFTTKKNGHGFGLHSGALAARELGGALTLHSDGPGMGATFTLVLPVAPPAPAAGGAVR